MMTTTKQDDAQVFSLLDRPEIAAEAFALNPNPTVHERFVGTNNHRVLVVDDFYANPERVLGLVDEIEFFNDPKITFSFPGSRAIARADLRHIVPAINAYSSRKPQPEDPNNMLLSIQGVWGNTPLQGRQRIPHNDPTANALVYLNAPEDCSGGTALYRHRATGIDWVPITPDEHMLALARELGYSTGDLATRAGYLDMTVRVIFNERFARAGDALLNEGNEHWELMDLIEMRTNRLVIFDGRIPHTLYVEPGTFEDVPRFVQMLSMKLDGDAW